MYVAYFIGGRVNVKRCNFEIVNIRDIRFDIHPCTPILFSQAFMNSNISIISFGSY